MILKNRLFILLCILTIKTSNINPFSWTEIGNNIGTTMKTITGADAPLKPQQQQRQQPQPQPQPQQPQQEKKFQQPNRDYTALFTKKIENSQPIEPNSATEEIGSWTATKALLRNAGRSIIGPVIEGALAVIGYGVKSIANSLGGDENKERRGNIYAGTAGALGAWWFYRWSQGESAIPYGGSIKSWWYNTGLPRAKNVFIQGNKVVNINDVD